MSAGPAERRLLAPGALWLAVFTGLPLVAVVALSFAGRGRPVEWALDGSAWGRLLDPRWAVVLGRSAGMAAAATAVCVVLGVPLAWWIARQSPGRRAALSFCVMLPLWANTVALLCAWKTILSRDGPADAFARAVGLLGDGETLGLLFTPGAVLLGLVYAYLPYLVHACLQTMERFDLRLLEAAEDLGASRLRALVTVALPVVRPGIVAGAILVFVPCLATFLVPDLLGGAKTTYAGNLVADAFLQDPQDWPLGAALGTTLLAVTAGATFVWYRFGDGARG